MSSMQRVIRETLSYPEQGVILGNGDFCVSVYQDKEEVIFRFGKGDIWDRRLEYERNPEPAHVEEIVRGLTKERWVCGAYDGEVTALNGSADARRMREICQPTPSELRPYPMPKPAGELALKLPADFHDLRIEYTLDLQANLLQITCIWREAVLQAECFVASRYDLFALHYELDCPHLSHLLMSFPNGFFPPFPRLYVQLRRFHDLTYPEFAARNGLSADFPMVADWAGARPLPRARVCGKRKIRQRFFPDPTFPEGFNYTLSLRGEGFSWSDVSTRDAARINAVAADEFFGTLAVGVETSLSTPGALPARFDFEQLKTETRRDSEAFWSRSRLELDEPVLETAWYDQLHLQRSIYGRGKVPPGLYIPCTIGDYVRWHGDYHSNYNFQSPFWGLAGSNHLELLESYFAGVDFFHEPGRMIAERYFHCRGAFIQLSAYPVRALDDYLGCCPMGRMVYMTGWIWHHHYEYYTHSLDETFLRERCWPLLKDCALFFTDFLRRESDGRYHLFPSNCGEEGFNGDPSFYRDREENIEQAAYTLRIAVRVARILGELEFAALWQERLDALAPISAHDAGRENRFRVVDPENPPEFRRTGYSAPEGLQFPPGDEFWTWYVGHAPMCAIAVMRGGRFLPERDLSNLAALIARWREPNGAITAMAPSRYGRTGAWTETLGIIGAINEMLLSCFDGKLNLFAYWPQTLNARFETFRTPGGFLVSARQHKGEVTATICSEKNGQCILLLRGGFIREWLVESGGRYEIRIRESGDVQFSSSCFDRH